MMFSRRYPAKLSQRMRDLVWPRTGLQRAWRYLWHRLKRLQQNPHSVALGFAIGVFVSFTPFFGLHLLLCVGFSFLLRVSILASLIGQVIGNPLTLPFIWLTSYKLGNVLLHRDGAAGAGVDGFMPAFFSFETMGHFMVPALTGGVLLGAIFGSLAYGGIYYLMTRATAIGGRAGNS